MLCILCSVSLGVKHQDSQNSFLAFLNAPTSALDQFDVSFLLPDRLKRILSAS